MVYSAPHVKHHSLIRYFVKMCRPLAAICLGFSLLSLSGYLVDLEVLYRPIPSGPATNPLTAILTTLLALGLMLPPRTRPCLSAMCAYIGLLFISMRLVDEQFGTSNAALITSFLYNPLEHLNDPRNNVMGLNTTAMLLLLCLANIFRRHRKAFLSQICSFIALAIPTVAITGYAYGLENFYGDMSLITTTLGLLLSISSLFITSSRGIVRAVLSPYIGGRIARVQVVVGYLFCFILGYMLVQSLVNTGLENLFGAYVVATSWFIILLVAMSAAAQEKIDRERRTVERKLNQIETLDQLTGLYNRVAFSQEASKCMAWQRRKNSTLYVMLMDVDYFKKINDHFGHSVGDEVLATIAKALTNSSRETDLLCRYGGEEFVALVDVNAHSGALIIAEKFRMAVEGIYINDFTDVHGALSVSIGCAPLNDMIGLEQALANADKAMYRAKHYGRNRVISFEQEFTAISA